MAVPSAQPNINSASVTSSQFLQSPLTTLIKSTDDTADDISLHDLLQAYGTLCDRLKLLATLANDAVDVPALNPLRHNAPKIAACLQRDFKRALQDPFPHAPEQRGGQIPESFASSTPEHSDEDMQYAQDLSHVSQHALLLFSTICRVELLWELFDGSFSFRFAFQAD